jgi:heme o synthase
MPHFFALSFMHRADYKRGGFQMLPCTEEDGERTAGVIVRNAWYLSAIPIVASLTEVTHSMFALEGMALNAYALTVAHRFQRERTNANARKIFLTSLWYLPSILMLFLLHSKTWDKQEAQVDEKEEDAAVSFLQHKIHALRDMGRGLCVHETVVASKTSKEEAEKACPIIVGQKEVGHVVDTAATTAAAALASAENGTATVPTLLVADNATAVEKDDSDDA